MPGTVAVSPDGLSATFTPSAALQPNTQYGVYLTGITDLLGQGLAQNGNWTLYFATGAGPQAGPLTVTSATPPNGAPNVPVNAVIEVQTSAALSVVSVGSSALTLKAGSSAVAGTVTVSGSLLRFTPSAPLTVSTAYTLTASGFTDLAGNAVQAFTSGFTTSSSSVPVSAPLTVSTVTPANAATNVAVASTVVVTYSAAVNPLTVSVSTLEVVANGAIVAGTYAVNGAVVTFTPLTPLPGSTVVTVYAGGYGVTDLAGNGGSTQTHTSFTTAAVADTTPPTIVSITPSNGATGVGPTGQIVITFSKSMNPATLTPTTAGYYNNITLLQNVSRLTFNLSVSADNRTVTLSGFNLPASTVITVVLSNAVQDLSGNALAAYQSSFTTAATFDTSRPSVENQRPGNGTGGVQVSTGSVVLFMNEAMNASTVPGALHISQNGQLVTGTVNVIDAGQTIVFTPTTAWQYGALVQVFLDTTAQGTNGNAAFSYQGSFSTVGNPATTAPSIVNDPLLNASGVPTNAVVEIGYNEPLNVSTMTAANVFVQLNSTGVNVVSTIGLDATGTVIRIVPNAALQPNKLYCYYVQAGVQGTNGLAAQQRGQCFTTGAGPQTVAPTVSVVSPVNQLSNVPVNANIRVQFSGPVDPLTVNDATIQVTAAGSSQTISFGSGNQVVQITPQNPLPASTQLTLKVSGVKDVAGNVVPTSTTTFTTGAVPDLYTPVVVSANPPANATNVPLNAALSLQTNAAIDPTSVSTGTFRLYDNTTGQYQSGGTTSVSPGGLTAYYVPSGPLATGRTYQIIFTNQGMTDLVGNLLSCCGINNFNFTTGFASSTTAPQITGVNPANGLTQVPINAQVVIQFNEPVNALSVGQISLNAGGGPVNVSSYLTNGNQTFVMVPLGALSGNTVYTVKVAGVTDLSGNAIAAPFTSTFTTSAVVDFTQPTVTQSDPGYNVTGIPTNTLVKLRFNKQVVLNASNIILVPYNSSSVVLPGSVVVAADGLSATFTPSAVLQANTQYAMYPTGITDLLGQGLAQNGGYVAYFATGAGPQAGPLTVTSVTPPGGAANVPVNAAIQVQASAALSTVSVANAGSGALALKAGGNTVAGTVSLSGSVLTFTPSAPLTVSTAYTLTAGGFTDLAGNQVQAFTSGFTTSGSSAPVTTPLTVSSVTPANAATNVPVATTVVVTYSAAVDPLTVSASTLEVVANGAVVAGSYAVNGAVVTFTPLTPLPGSTVVTVYSGGYGVRDLAGNGGSAGFSTTFTTAAVADTTPPTIISVTPSSGATGIGPTGQIVLTFSKSMNPATLTSFTGSYYNNITLLANVSRLTFNLSVSADNRTATLYNFNLPVSTAITVVVSHAVQDLSGNALADYQSGFTTAANFDTSRPSVVNQRPGNGTGGVQVSTGSVVLFMNEAMNASTVPGALHISQNGQLVTGTVNLIDSGQVIVFTPTTAWQYGSLVQVFLDTTAQGANGNAAFSYQGSFSTVSNPATTAPSIVNPIRC